MTEQTPDPSMDGAPVDIDTRIRELPVRAELTEDSLVLETDLAGTEDELWLAITDPERLGRWSPVVPDRPLTAVGPARSREHPEDDPVAADVLDVAGRHAVTHRWGEARLAWMVEEGRLVLQTTLPDLAEAQYYAAGWQVCLAVLDAQLSGLDQERIVGMDAMDHGWEELRARYAAEFGHPDGPAPEA